MEGPCLFMVIAGLLASSVGCHEVASSYSGCQWNNVHFLNCRSTGITTLGDHFFLDQTTKNVTSSNHLQRCIRTTTHIDLSYNMMSALYLNVFYKFASLETLNLKNNQIYKMSMNEKNEKGAFLTSLQRLVLNGNRLIAIPKGLCKLKSLQTLSLSANRILYVQGDDFANCTNLQHIDLGENRISNIHPDSFRDLRNLQVLKLNSNTLLSLSPLVFLFKHILKADIDLSDNPWVCDCSLQPLKYLISSLSTGVRKPWNATCRAPFSKAGKLILSVEISKSCQTSDYSHVFDKTLLIAAGEEATLDCESFNQLRNKDILWWTPHGIISNERQNSNYYLSNTNSLIIKQPNDSDEGLYLCLTNAARIAYQVGIQVNNLKSIRRSPRDLQLRNVRMPSQQNFDLAVSLSVIVTFLIAFFLGVFIRPYLESLWRKWCKSKNAEAQHSDEVYENEGFTPDFTTRKDGAKSNVSSIPQYKTGQTYEMNDNYKLETENITQRQERAIDVEIPTHNAVQEIGEEINKPANRMPRTKRVKWASNEDISANVNLKYLMSLIKPINFIVLDSSMPDMVYDHQSNNTIAEDFNHISGHTNDDTTKMSDDSCSSDEGSSFSLGSDYDVSDNDSIVNEVLQVTKQGGQDCTDNVSPTINLKHLISLLKPIHIIVPDSTVPVLSKSPKQNKDTFKTLYDTNSSDESYIYAFDSEYELSDEDEILNVNVLKTKKSNVSPTVNLKYVMSLLKPINIIVPETTTTQIVKSPKQKQFFPLTMPEYPENRMENLEHFAYIHDQDKQITNDQCKSLLPNISPIHYTTGLNDSSFSDEESNISVNSENNFSAEDAFIGYNFLKTQTQLANETLSPTVNLKHLISLLRPINITIPDSTIPTVIRTSTEQQLFPISISRYPANKMENADISSDNHDKDNSIQVERSEGYLQSTDPRNQYSDSKNSIEVTWPAYDSSSSEDSSNDTDDSDQATGSVLTKPLPRKWVSNEIVYPTVNLRQIISTFKPIKIKVPDACHYLETLVSPKEHFEVTSEKLYYYSSSDEHSNDSVDSDHDSTFEFVTKTFPVPAPRKRADSEKVYYSVNLKNIISSLKPIHINIPDSTNYSDTLVTLKMNTEVTQNPEPESLSESSNDSADSEHESVDEEVIKKNIEATQKQFDSTSSDESSNDPFDPKYESSDEEVVRTPALLPTTGTEWASFEDLPPTVNLKQIISSLKPIHINIPDTKCNLDILVKKDIDVAQKPYDFSISNTTASDSSDDSTDSEHEGSDEECKQSIIFPEATTECKNHDYPMTTVNLKHVISSLKPFHVNVPDSTNYSDPQVFPKKNIDATQKLFDSTSSDESSNDPFDSKYENSDEEVIKASALLVTTGTGWMSSEDLPPTVNLKQIMSSLKPIHINIPDTTCNLDILVKKDIDVAQKPYDFSISDTTASDSSDDSTESEHEGSDEECKQSIIFPEATTECKNHDYPMATVNLKHVISSLKPFHVNVPDSTNYSDPQVFPKKNIDATQNLFDSTSSDESSNDPFDSKYENSDEEVIKAPALLVTTGTGWVSSEDLPPTVNLKQIMSSLKPICIKVPDAGHYSNFPFQTNINTKDNHPLYDSTLSDEGSKNSVSSSEDIMHSTEDIMSGSYVADTAETTTNLYGSSSSDEDSNESSDLECEGLDGEIRSAILHIPTLKEAANNENVYATINLKHVIFSFKPICFAVSDSTPYSDTLVHSKKNIEEVTQSSYNSISSDELSNDSSHSRYKGSDEEVIMSSALLEPPTTDWVNDKNHMPTVNLEHVISSFKPICIVVADSYKMTTVVTPKLYDHSSSDERSNDSADLEHECSSEHLMTFPLPKPIQTGQESNENVCPTVNLKHLISLLNPIQIKVPDATCYLDIVTSPKENIETTIQNLQNYSPSDESSNGSVDSEHESSDEGIIRTTNIPKRIPTWASNENLSFTVNLRHLMSTFKPLDITVAHSTKYLGTSLSPNTDTEVMQKLYGDILPDTIPNDSDNSDSKGSENVVISNLPETVSTKLPSNEKVYTTVNLKNVISLFKPISIKHPHSTNYSESFIIPTKAVEVSKELYKNSSSDESSAESGHEGSYEVTNHRMRNNSSTDDDSTDEESMLKDSHKDILLDQHSTLPKPTPTEWTRNENLSPTVNLRHIISLFKPVKIKIQDSAYHSGSPKKNMQITQEKYDNSSHDNSSADSEHEYPDTSVIKSSSLPKLTPTEKVPESNPYEDTPMTSKKNREVTSNTVNNISLPNEYSNYFADSDHEGSVEYMERRTEQERQGHVYPTVNLKHLTSLIKPIRIKVPDAAHYSDTLKSSKKKNKVTAEKLFDNSSSNESSQDSTDSEHENSNENIMSSKLAKPTLTEWASTEIAYPTVNLKNVTSLLKPINIMSPDTAVPEVPTWNPYFSDSTKYKENQTDNFDKYQPVSHSFSQPKSKLHNKHYKHHFSYAFKNSRKNKNVILTSYKKMLSNNTSDNIDEWSHKGLNKSDTTNSDLLTSNLAAGASNEDDAPVVNLKHVMSLLKPVKFVDAELTKTELVKHPPPVPPRKSRKKFQEQSSLSFHEKPMESRSPVQYATVSKDLSQNDLIKFDTDDLEEVVL